jgi:hypothetical protein
MSFDFRQQPPLATLGANQVTDLEEPLDSATSDRPRLLLSGPDSLYVSHYLTMANSSLDFEELAFQKERVKQSRGDQFAEIRLALRPLPLGPMASTRTPTCSPTVLSKFG